MNTKPIEPTEPTPEEAAARELRMGVHGIIPNSDSADGELCPSNAEWLDRVSKADAPIIAKHFAKEREEASRQVQYWEEEARRYCGNADFWRERFEREAKKKYDGMVENYLAELHRAEKAEAELKECRRKTIEAMENLCWKNEARYTICRFCDCGYPKHTDDCIAGNELRKLAEEGEGK